MNIKLDCLEILFYSFISSDYIHYMWQCEFPCTALHFHFLLICGQKQIFLPTCVKRRNKNKDF